ncbi:T9SS type A sorting domain-containing protein [Oscillatoria amoena NRMC-F 0135]|nr:T9SS type A sorting domain-containing protein [Oscillatoria amoena NRMC-F 0135]
MRLSKFVVAISLFAGLGMPVSAQNLAPVPALQQKIDYFTGEQFFMSAPVENTADKVGEWAAKQFLKGAADYTLANVIQRTSPDGTYYTYEIHYLGAPLYSKSIKVFVDKASVIRYAYHNIANLATADVRVLPTKDFITQFYTNKYPQLALTDNQSVWVDNGEKPVPAFYLTMKDNEKHSVNQLLFGADGSLLFSRPMESHFAADTPANVYVYDPDPLTTANVVYGGAYSNNGGQDNAQLQAQLKKRTVRVDLLGDSMILANSSFYINEISSPVWPPTRVHISDTFKFSRNHFSFGETNAFYHLNTHKAYIHSLGYTGLPGYRLQVDAHAFNGAENSKFTPGDNPPSLQFGDGGIPDAEDAEVVIHEFGHAISHGASPNSAFGHERVALDEGLGDYFAVSYTKAIDAFNWTKVFSWDGNNGGWQGRTVNYLTMYPNLTNSIWADGQLWSTSFMRLYDDVGKEIADKLMLETLYRLSANISMPQLAKAVQQIDSIKYGGIHSKNIQCAFALSGILQGPAEGCTQSIHEGGNLALDGVRINNTYAFAAGTGVVEVIFSNSNSYTVSLSDISGKLISCWLPVQGQNVTINGQHLASGVYFLQINDGEGNIQTQKLMRY